MRPKYYRFTPEERLKYIREFLDDDSGITIVDFCKIHDIRRTTFTGWLDRYQQRFGEPTVPNRGFIDITEEANNRAIATSGCNSPVICSTGIIEPSIPEPQSQTNSTVIASADNVVYTLGNGKSITFHISNLKQVLEVLS